jgi:hypothetical protein
MVKLKPSSFTVDITFFRFYFIMASFPCGKCFLECEGEKTIACDNCDKWFHQKCESLSNIHFSVLGKSSFSYFCSEYMFCILTRQQNFQNSDGDGIKKAITISSGLHGPIVRI